MSTQKEHEPHCYYCGKKSQHGITHPQCKRTNGVDGSLSLFEYKNNVVDVLHRVKYCDEWRLLPDLVSHASHGKMREILWWKRMCAPLLCPVPLFTAKELSRGFNQAEIFGRVLSLKLGLTMIDPLVRIKNTPPLALMPSGKSRHNAVKGAFELKNDVEGTVVMVVDDIITSGSTISECAKVLKAGGARVVLAVSVAKG